MCSSCVLSGDHRTVGAGPLSGIASYVAPVLYNLPPIWNNIIKERLTESAMGATSGGGAQSEESVSVPVRL